MIYNTIKTITFISLVLIITSSCSVLQPNRMFKVNKDIDISDFKPSNKEYTIQPYDKLSISITSNDGFKLIPIGENKTMSNNSNNRFALEYLVEFDGFVKLPTLGRIQISGKTIREAESFLEKNYSEYYKKPFVLLTVVNRKVYIFKNGGESGSVINIPDDRLTLVEALAMSGGLNDSDKAYKIRLIRGDLTSSPKVFNYSIRSLNEIKGANLLLQANDIIYIESRPKYVRRVLTELTPYLTLVSTILLVYNLF